MKRIILVLLLCASGLFAAARSVNAAGPRRSDAEIEAAIRTKLAKSKIGRDGFQVHVKNGIVTWTGATGVMQHKGAATRMARTAGAVQVVNNIKISDEARQRSAEHLAGGPRRVAPKLN